MKKNLLTRKLMLLISLLMVLMTSCQEDKVSDFQLYYRDVVDMGQSMSFTTGIPSYSGGEPTDFAIASVKIDDTEVVAGDNFIIDAVTGAVTITKTADLTIGTYTLSIRCIVNGTIVVKKDVLNIELLPSVPEKIGATESVVNIEYERIGEAPDTLSVVNVESSTCSVLSYKLVQEKDREYFAISNTGVISLNKDFLGDVLPGSYPLMIELGTKAGKQTYSDIVSINITSAPLELSYTPNLGKMEYNYAFASAIPYLKGSKEELQYFISVFPETDKIKIDAQSGAIFVEESSGLEIGDRFDISVSVRNKFGQKDFANVFELEVLNFIKPISNFSYKPARKYETAKWEILPEVGFVGDEVTFSIISLPEELQGLVTFSSITGGISVAKNNNIPRGKYSIKIKAANVKNEAEAICEFEIVENPNAFTKIIYGNNLGLDFETHANQFAFNDVNEQKSYDLSPITDIPSGANVIWSLEVGDGCNITSDVKIDSKTGRLTNNKFKSGEIIFVFVRATVAKDTDEEYSLRVPVFFYGKKVTSDGISLSYAPFIVQINPQKGGKSEQPIITGLADGEKVAIMYRRSFYYYNLEGPTSHGAHSFVKSEVAGSLLSSLWTRYYKSISKPVNLGAYNPVCQTVDTSNDNKFMYVNVDNQFVVNLDKWKDDNGIYLNGLFRGQIVYMKYAGEAPAIPTLQSSPNASVPVIMWFDTKF